MNLKTNRYNSVQQMMTREPALPQGFNIDKIDDPGNFMNRTMQTYIERVRLEPKEFVRERGAFARWFGFHASATSADIPILFKDPWMSYSNYFLCGLDFDFLMLDVLIVTFIDIVASGDMNLRSRLMLGILIAYIIDSLLIFLRKYFGRRNLARHALADERFLI